MSLAAWLAAGGGPKAHYPVLSSFLWLAAVFALVITGLRDWRPSRRVHPGLWIVVGIFLLAWILRIVDLAGIPAIFSGNEAGVGLSAMEYVRGERTNLFSLGWWSFPALYSYIQSWPLRLFGATVFGVRVSSTLVGALTVGATYLYAKRAFGPIVGLASAAFLAVSGFHIHFSRLGLNNVWESLLAVLLAAALAYAWETGEARRFVLAGVVLGLMQFFYVGGRMFIGLLPLWVLIAFSRDLRPVRKRLGEIGAALWAAAVVALPLAVLYAQHPDEFFAPWRRVSLFWYWWDIQTIQYGDPGWWVVADQLIKAPLGFMTAGLTEFYSGPLLTPVAAALFLVGGIHVLRRLRDPNRLWIALWLGGTMATVALSAHPPAAQRYAGASSAAAILVAMGVADFVARLRLSNAKNPAVWRATVAGLLLLAAAAWEIRHYFIVPSAAEAFGDPNAEIAFRVAESLQHDEGVRRVYLFVSSRMGLAGQETVLLLAPGVPAQDVEDGDDWRIEFDQAGDYSLVFLPERADDLAVIQSCVKGGETERMLGRQGVLLFSRYRVHIDAPVTCSGASTPAPSSLPPAGSL